MSIPGMRPLTDCQIQVSAPQVIHIQIKLKGVGRKQIYDFKREQGGIYGSALREQRDGGNDVIIFYDKNILGRKKR